MCTLGIKKTVRLNLEDVTMDPAYELAKVEEQLSEVYKVTCVTGRKLKDM